MFPFQAKSRRRAMSSTSTRRLRAFKRWMLSQKIDCEDTVELTDSPDKGIAVIAVSDLKKHQVISVIPKTACLTIKSSAAREMIEAAGLDGVLGLAVAIMYEKSLGEDSQWAGYLQLLPEEESLPLVWTLDEVDQLLRGTELHETVKEDKILVAEDWKECILPLLESEPLKLNLEFFGIEQYFSAKTLIASRSFTVDDYHGIGMVPLADLFNHKVGAEDVHITNVTSNIGSDMDESENDSVSDNVADDDQSTDDLAKSGGSISSSGNNSDISSEDDALSDGSGVLQMIIQQDVKSGNEVFNTYGRLGNAALLHRYGFTEEHNQFDVVNIDFELVTRWSSGKFSDRYTRARVSLWRKLGYSGCISQDSEYFEVYCCGTPPLELIILLYILLLPEKAYDKLNIAASVEGDHNLSTVLLANDADKNNTWHSLATRETTDALLLTDSVCDALVSIVDLRESFYGVESSLEDDLNALRKYCRVITHRKLYYSLVLRYGERWILQKLRCKSSSAGGSFKREQSTARRKKMKRKR